MKAFQLQRLLRDAPDKIELQPIHQPDGFLHHQTTLVGIIKVQRRDAIAGLIDLHGFGQFVDLLPGRLCKLRAFYRIGTDWRICPFRTMAPGSCALRRDRVPDRMRGR